MSEYFGNIAQWFYSLTGAQIVSLVLIALAAGFAFTAAKAILKVAAGAIGFLAILYLVNPSVYNWAIELLGQIFVSAQSIVA